MASVILPLGSKIQPCFPHSSLVVLPSRYSWCSSQLQERTYVGSQNLMETTVGQSLVTLSNFSTLLQLSPSFILCSSPEMRACRISSFDSDLPLNSPYSLVLVRTVHVQQFTNHRHQCSSPKKVQQSFAIKAKSDLLTFLMLLFGPKVLFK